jgi:hypothetical protein
VEGRNIFRSSTAIAVLLGCLIGVSLLVETQPDFIYIVFAVDAYGNDLDYISVYQWNTTGTPHWTLRANFTATGGTVRVEAAKALNFTVAMRLNGTLVSSTAEAILYTNIKMNITTGIWTNKELNNSACSYSAPYYRLRETGKWNVTAEPVAGTTYQASVKYFAEY